MGGEFVCDKCGCVDLVGLMTNPSVFQCSECSTGKWHGQFPKRQYNPEVDIVVNRPNGLGMEG